MRFETTKSLTSPLGQITGGKMQRYSIIYYFLHAVPAWPNSPLHPSNSWHPPPLPSPCLPHSPPCCAWLLLFDLCPRLQVGGAGVQSWPITIRASPSVTRPLWDWIMSRLPTADSPVSGNLSNMDQWELRTRHGSEEDEGGGGVIREKSAWVKSNAFRHISLLC